MMNMKLSLVALVALEIVQRLAPQSQLARRSGGVERVDDVEPEESGAVGLAIFVSPWVCASNARAVEKEVARGQAVPLRTIASSHRPPSSL